MLVVVVPKGPAWAVGISSCGPEALGRQTTVAPSGEAITTSGCPYRDIDDQAVRLASEVFEKPSRILLLVAWRANQRLLPFASAGPAKMTSFHG